MDNSGQGEGLVAYIRLWSWYNSNSSERKYEYRQQVLSLDRCKAVSGVADAIERWESRLASVQEADGSFSCSEGLKIALLRKILPESLDKEVALRTSELGDIYDKMRSFIMKYALQEGPGPIEQGYGHISGISGQFGPILGNLWLGIAEWIAGS